MIPLVFIGGGGHALSVLGMLGAGYAVNGYVDACQIDGFPAEWLGTDSEFMASYAPEDTPVHIAVIMGHDSSLSVRAGIINRYRKYAAPVLVAETAVVTPFSTVGRGSAVMHRAVVNGACLGDYNVVNTGAIVEHGVITGENVFIGPGAVVCGGVKIGNNVMVGAGAVIRNNVSIPSGTIIGISAAITKNLPEQGVYAGVPAKKIKG